MGFTGFVAPPPEKPHPRPEVPTTTQLGLKPSKLLLRGLVGRCPVCGAGKQFERWFSMKDRCPTCDLLHERVEGHWIGAIGVNTVVVMGLMLLVLLVVAFAVAATDGDLPVGWLLGVEIGIAVLGPLVFFPPSRQLWTAMDLLMRPLKPGEVDPRFVLVDPLRDRPGTA